ncbi:hypothetical protein ACWGTO_14630 [Mesorhizobium sp. PL10]
MVGQVPAISVSISRAGDASAGLVWHLVEDRGIRDFTQTGRVTMKKVYEKPTLSKREKLSCVTAGIPLSQQA